MNDYTDWDRPLQNCSFHPSVGFIHLVLLSTVGNYSECGFLRLFWVTVYEILQNSSYMICSAFPQHTELAVWSWIKIILLRQDLFLTNPGKLLFMSMFSSRCLQAEFLVIFFRILPGVKSIDFFYLKKENREWKGNAVKWIDNSFQIETEENIFDLIDLGHAFVGCNWWQKASKLTFFFFPPPLPVSLRPDPKYSLYTKVDILN